MTPNFETSFQSYLTKNHISHENNTDSFTVPDFTVFLDNTPLHVELKEKAQPYRMDIWPVGSLSQDQVFICDELTIRKLLLRSPLALLVICDRLQKTMCMWNILDLVFGDKIRCNRPVKGTTLKGKVLLNMDQGKRSTTYAQLFGQMKDYIRDITYLYAGRTKCYPVSGTEVPVLEASVNRSQRYKDYDLRMYTG